MFELDVQFYRDRGADGIFLTTQVLLAPPLYSHSLSLSLSLSSPSSLSALN